MAPLVVAAAAAVTIAPWTIRNAAVFGEFVPTTTQSGAALAGIFNDEARAFNRYPGTWRPPLAARMYVDLYRRRDLNEAQLDSRLRSRALDYAADHPDYAAEAAWFNTLRVFELAPADPTIYRFDQRQQNLSPAMVDVVRWSSFLLMAVALAGAALLVARSRGQRGPLFIWLFPLLAVGGPAILGLTRYRGPVYPFLAMLAAIAIVDGSQWLVRRRDAEPAPA
jgi:hypothetical protein